MGQSEQRPSPQSGAHGPSGITAITFGGWSIPLPGREVSREAGREEGVLARDRAIPPLFLREREKGGQQRRKIALPREEPHAVAGYAQGQAPGMAPWGGEWACPFARRGLERARALLPLLRQRMKNFDTLYLRGALQAVAMNVAFLACRGETACVGLGASVAAFPSLDKFPHFMVSPFWRGQRRTLLKRAEKASPKKYVETGMQGRETSAGVVALPRIWQLFPL